MKIKITKYSHSIIISCIGILFTAYDFVWSSLLGGFCIGVGLLWARQYGENNCK